MELENRKPLYRMYIDEVGNADLKSSDEPNHRFKRLKYVSIGFSRSIANNSGIY